MPPHDRTVTLARAAPGWVVSLPWRGIVEHCPTLAKAIRKAEAVAAEFQARLTIELGEYTAGGFGPRHLIGSPSIFVAEEDDGSWSVCMAGRPSQFPSPNQTFIGPNAERAADAWAFKALAAVRECAEAVASRKERMRALANKERRELLAERRGARP